ncbi:MAG: hypothetical protein QHC88_16785 [Achromobacter sp.]|nr:hypothetical protein [Achromobacter sp.]MDX3986906.1 hypothetical protein [Achromobacter sp.]
MTWWQILLAVLAFIVLIVFLAIRAKAAAYRRDADEHGDNDAQNR